MSRFDLRAMLQSQPADEQPPQELVHRLEHLLQAAGELLDDYPRPWGGGSLEEQDLRLELNSANKSRHVVIQLGETLEYIYYSYQPPSWLGDPKISATKKPVNVQNLLWVLRKLAQQAEHDA